MANYDVELNKHPWYRKIILILIFGTLRSYDPLGRGSLPKGKKRPRSLRSLGLASLLKVSPEVVDIRVFCCLFVVCICSAGCVELPIVLLYSVVSTLMLGVLHAIQNKEKL